MRRCLAVCVAVIFLLFGAVSPARADTTYSYLDENGDLQQRTIAAGHVIGGDWDLSSSTLTGWYAVTGMMAIYHTLEVQGEAVLILTDGASLSVSNGDRQAGIQVPVGNSLTIYAQSTGADMGSLTATSSFTSAGIGGNGGQSCGAVTINGGYVVAISSSGSGIGGGGGASAMPDMDGVSGGNGGDITINGGMVTASSYYGTGIGGGVGGISFNNTTGGSGGSGGTLVVNGGSVTANSHNGAGIGGGVGGDGAPVGGNGGSGGAGATVTVNGGSVTANATYGAGIGGGNGGHRGTEPDNVGGSGGGGGIVTINGGVVTASSECIASIGGGDGDYFSPSNHGGDGGTITINDGTVIGNFIGMGGSRGPSGTVEINGGSVNGRLCTGWYSAGGTATIRGGTVVSPGIAKGLYGFAGGTVNISGGTVTVGSDGIANGNTGGGVVISGGSVNVAGTMGSMPTNGSANGSQEVYLTQPRLDNVKTVTAVSALTLSNASYYGMKDLYTDADGTLYLYLPADAAATGVQAAGRTYVGSVAAGESGALALPATDSALSGLALSHGTLDPAFDPATTGYAVSVPYGVTGVTVTPTVSDTGKATVAVNGVAAESGSATGEIPLAVGDNTIQVVCTAEDTVTQTTYTITVTRSIAPAVLSGLALSEGTLDPAFDPATTGYAVSVPYGVTGVTVTPTVSDPGRATVTVNGVAAESGSATGEIPLAVGDNIIQVVFTTEDHTTTTYTITVTRSMAPVVLSGLALSHGTLDPAFDPATTGYAVSVPYDVTGVTVTPTVSDPGRATVTVNGVTAESGSATGEIPLDVGDNTIQVVFTPEDHTTTTYAIAVTRRGAPVISVQPTDKTVTEGQKATFTVVASGIEPLSYQWYVDREGAKGWVKIDSASARTATYTTSATKLRDSGCRYACLVENGAGSIRTDAVTLTVIEKSAPQTGDDSHLPLWIALALLSGLGLAALLATGRRGLNRR